MFRNRLKNEIKQNKEQTINFLIQSLAVCSLFFLSMLFGAGCTEQKESKEGETGNHSLKKGVAVGNLAPDFKINNLKGGSSALSDYRGKVVLVNFWATWCEPCRDEMPSMELLYQSHSQDDFEILALSIDSGNHASVKAFVEDFSFTFPILLDSKLEVNDRYQVRVLPTSILIDKKGLVADRFLGGKDWNSQDTRSVVAKLVEAGR
ncbi:MAG: TlpA disulfide reductase family protein [Nitrospiria bacterium]